MEQYARLVLVVVKAVRYSSPVGKGDPDKTKIEETMLGLHLKLTPAQVKTLLMLQYGHRERIEYTDCHGNKIARWTLPIELLNDTHYLLSFAALERRGLVEQQEDGPRVTGEGTAVCALIYKQALAITQLVESRATIKEEANV